MSGQKVRDFETCGLVGKTARARARYLLEGIKIDRNEAQEAVAHIVGCDYCRQRIKNQIADARLDKKSKAYLDSLPETLAELQKRLAALT